MAFSFNPNTYKEHEDFPIIPEGEYRVRISDVERTTFSSGNQGFKLTLDVSGYNSHVWSNLVIIESDPERTNQRFGDFFNSFGIDFYDLGQFPKWSGHVGGAKIKHETYQGKEQAKVAYFLNKRQQEKLPAWKEPTNSTPKADDGFVPVDAPEDVPF